MISLNFEKMTAQMQALAQAYEELPKHIAKKHIRAAMGRAVKKTGGVQVLRSRTPPLGVTRGRRKKGEKPRSTGELRKSVTVKTGWKGKNDDGTAFAMLGYRYGWNSRKAIWAEYGTKWRDGLYMAQETFNEIKGGVAASLEGELADALEKAVNEVNAMYNPGYPG